MRISIHLFDYLNNFLYRMLFYRSWMKTRNRFEKFDWGQQFHRTYLPYESFSPNYFTWFTIKSCWNQRFQNYSILLWRTCTDWHQKRKFAVKLFQW